MATYVDARQDRRRRHHRRRGRIRRGRRRRQFAAIGRLIAGRRRRGVTVVLLCSECGQIAETAAQMLHGHLATDEVSLLQQLGHVAVRRRQRGGAARHVRVRLFGRQVKFRLRKRRHTKKRHIKTKTCATHRQASHTQTLTRLFTSMLDRSSSYICMPDGTHR